MDKISSDDFKNALKPENNEDEKDRRQLSLELCRRCQKIDCPIYLELLRLETVDHLVIQIKKCPYFKA